MNTEPFKQRLLALQQSLRAGQTERDSASATVELDQTSVGRLSRMDALQMQAMAKAEQGRARVQLKQIGAALKRIEQGDYGDCLECDQPIAPARLEVDPAASLCFSCADRLH